MSTDDNHNTSAPRLTDEIVLDTRQFKPGLHQLLRDAGDQVPQALVSKQYGHYFRELPTNKVDIYRLILAYQINDPCIQHALKKLFAAGQRGSKDTSKDIQEAIDSLKRYQEMRAEESSTD